MEPLKYTVEKDSENPHELFYAGTLESIVDYPKLVEAGWRLTPACGGYWITLPSALMVLDEVKPNIYLTMETDGATKLVGSYVVSFTGCETPKLSFVIKPRYEIKRFLEFNAFGDKPGDDALVIYDRMGAISSCNSAKAEYGPGFSIHRLLGILPEKDRATAEAKFRTEGETYLDANIPNWRNPYLYN